MEEWIRFHEVSAVSGTLAPLRSLNLSLFAGEILFVIGSRWSGKTLLRRILSGQAQISSGKLYLSEERYRKKNFAGEPILCVDRNSRLTGVLSLKANLLSLGGGRRGKEKFRNEREIRQLFEKMGIGSSPAAPAEQVPVREQLLLWFVLAVIRQEKLLCLDCSGFSFSEEDYQVLGQAVRRCREYGTGILIFDDHENSLMEYADRIAWMRRGQIRKIFYSVQEYRKISETAQGRSRQEIPAWDAEKEGLPFAPGRILGIYDVHWPMDLSLPDYLTRRLREIGAELPDFLPMEGCCCRDAVYIPEDSIEDLFDGESIGRNILLTVSHLVGVRAGFVQMGTEKFLEKEFCRRFEGEEEEETVGEMTDGRKKLLSIYRFVLLKPRVLLLENPLMQSDWEERSTMIGYLKELASSGISMVISAKSPDDLEMLCDRIWRVG